MNTGLPQPEQRPRVVERVVGVSGELVLREWGGHHEIIADGMFLMDTRDGRSECAMVDAGLRALPQGHCDARVLIAGLGVGFTARAALDSAQVALVHVLELEQCIIDWHRGPLAPRVGHLLEEPRCVVEHADIVSWINTAPAGTGPTSTGYDLVCLDVDNGPDWTLRDDNAWLYGNEALQRLRALAGPTTVLAVWSAAPSPGFATRLAAHCGPVTTVTVSVERGEADVVYLARLGN